MLTRPISVRFYLALDPARPSKLGLMSCSGGLSQAPRSATTAYSGQGSGSGLGQLPWLPSVTIWPPPWRPSIFCSTPSAPYRPADASASWARPVGGGAPRRPTGTAAWRANGARPGPALGAQA
jgi:hypothetical protein